MFRYACSAVGAAALCTIATFGQPSLAKTIFPEYDASGRLKIPQGYENWVFVGSNLGLAYKPDAVAFTAQEAERAGHQLFHNIYIDPAAYAEFVRAGTFPDPTILVMENYAAETKDAGGVLSEGFFNGSLVRVEVAVKNSKRPTKPGSVETWAYYFFPLGADGRPIEAAVPLADQACHACHQRHAGPDNVWVQFYPQLRRWLKP
ncbi:cytochrome P460 family protein [Rhizobium leguminosarum]|uniref:cytochrome P460 family protein n=1 Tax=Rhizobium leguminosarum TaxID=384 RepID=UPI001C965535|nr:cytochrome P460 family protein [Rhizobium leguminosarum]MBY5560564.1 cytochrome P460 family protein [Rhizobium leguminosarum]MBY5708914.1 cytochrome P460 family protein [Rhizobium leguminosarum]